MKASAEKSATLASTTATRTASQPFFAKAGASSFFEPAARTAAPAVQLKMQVNQPGDAFEQEADHMADRVVRAPMPLVKDPWQPSGPASLTLNEPRFPKTTLPTSPVQRAELPDEKRPLATPAVQRQSSAGAPTVGAGVQAAIRQQTAGGQPLAADVRSYMEPRFGADFSQVRVHHDAAAAGLSAQLSARAFTHQNHVFFSPGQYQPGTSEGRHLLAHELTHTIQQGHAIQRHPQVAATATAPPIQRLGLRDLPGVGSVLDYFAEVAYLIPGFRLLTLVVGFNPITQQTTDRSAANLLRALIELLPAGFVVAQALDNHGVFTKAGAWVEQRLAAFRSIGGSLVAGLRALLSGNPLSLLNPGALWAQARQLLAAPVGQLISFAGSVASDLLHLVKTAILKPLAALAEGTAGYDLLKALLGEDPVTGEAVPRNADTLLGGFMKLIGQEEIWQNLKKGNAVPRAWAWFQGALAGLLGFARSIPQRVGATLASLTFQEVLTVAGAFARVVGNLAGIAGEFMSWGLQQVISLLEILFSVVAPGAVPYIKKAQGAFQTILRNPIGFVNNLVQAGKLGFLRFAGNIAGHLMKGLLAWLTAPMARAGIYVLKSFSLPEILKMVASALGLTWANIRKKLLKIIPEPVLVALEKTAGILVTFVQQGPAAALEQIKGELTGLKDQLISQVIEMVTSQVVQAAVTKLVSLLNPAGAVIQAILAIYNTISVFLNQLSQIGAVVAAFIDSIAAIATGQLDGAAKKVEQTMAGLLPIVIAFFAKFAGAGSIPDKLFGLVMKGQKFVDKGIDKVVAWLGGLLKKLGMVLENGKDNVLEWWNNKVAFSDKKGNSHKLFFSGRGKTARMKVASTEMFTEEFIAKVEAEFAKDALAKSFGLQALNSCKKYKSEIEKLQVDLERAKKNREPSVPGMEATLKSKMNLLSVSLASLFDVLPENSVTNFVVKVGEFVTMLYGKAKRKAEILFISKDRVNYKLESVSAKLQLPTSTFKFQWDNGDIFPYEEDGSRQKYLGATPGKASATGKVVIAKYTTRTTGSAVEVNLGTSSSSKWWKLEDCDMSHEPLDAVDYWNTVARPRRYKPKGPEIRNWMLDPANYALEDYPTNRSRGSRNNSNYKPPLP